MLSSLYTQVEPKDQCSWWEMTRNHQPSVRTRVGFGVKFASRQSRKAVSRH